MPGPRFRGDDDWRSCQAAVPRSRWARLAAPTGKPASAGKFSPNTTRCTAFRPWDTVAHRAKKEFEFPIRLGWATDAIDPQMPKWMENRFGSVLLTDLDNLTPIQRSLYVARRDEFEAGLLKLIDTGVRRGIYERDDVKLASLAMLGAINWLPKWYRPEGALAPHEVAVRLADFLMRAIERKVPDTARTVKRAGVSSETSRAKTTLSVERRPRNSRKET